jgi:hypothetical protein
MSFTVFSARSIAHDLESAVGEEAFYFYMREIIDSKLYEKYKDGVNGEERKFDGLLQFMQHKDGLGIKDLSLFEKCLSVVASSSHKMAEKARWFMVELQEKKPLPRHGEIGNGRKDESRGDKITSTDRGTSQRYLLQRLARDAPDILERVKTGEIKSARAAAIEAGIITAFPSIALKDPVHAAQRMLDRKGQAWCLQLLEELSELVL